MNVILIFSDTLRADHVGCYGNPRIHTPHLDRFSEEAVVFDRAHCASFPTVSCRNDVLTGLWTFAYKGWEALEPDVPVLPSFLNDAGRLTALFADTPHPFKPGFNYQRGFRVWEVIRGQEGDAWKSSPAEVTVPCAPEKLRYGHGLVSRYMRNVAWRRSEEDYFPARTIRTAAGWLERNHDRPFFLYVDTFDPHEPFDPPAHYLKLYEPEPYHGDEVTYPVYDRWKDFMSEEELAHVRNLYAGEVTLVDRWIGYLLQRVKDLGLYDDTAIIITSDHGFYFGEHGYIGKSIIRKEGHRSLPLYPEVSRVPLLIRMPGGRGGRRSKAFAQPVDFMPTILELSGVEGPDGMEGKSLVPVLEGDDDLRPFAVSAPALTESYLERPRPTNQATITTDEWSFVVGARVDEAAAGSVKDGLGRFLPPEGGVVNPELYHLPSDPGCTRNVLAGNEDVARRLHSRFVEFLRGTRLRRDHLPYFEKVPAVLE